MLLLPARPVVQFFSFNSKPPKHPPRFVNSHLASATSSLPSPGPAQPFSYCHALAFSTTSPPEVIQSSYGRKSGSEVWSKVWKIELEKHCRGLGRDYTRATRKGLGFDKGLAEGGGVDCYADLKGRERLIEGQQTSSSSDGVLPQLGAMSNCSSSMEGKSLWSKLSQSVNVSGLTFSARVVLKDRHLAMPHVSVPDISWIDWKALRARGFEGVSFDKDNTLTAPYGQDIWPPLKDSLEECREVFGGRIALLSNSAGLYQYDPLGEEANDMENKLGIPVIRHGQKKPAGKATALSNHFGCDPSMLIMVGDRYFTDIIYGNNNGLLTIRPAPLTTLREPFTVKRVRVLEDSLVDWWCRQGILPPKHRFFDNPVDFIKDPGCW